MITSPQNTIVQRARALRDPATRRAERRFLAEGVRLLEEAFASQLTCEQLFYSAKLDEQPQGRQLLSLAKRARAPQVEVSDRVLSTLKETKTPQGAIGLFRQPRWPSPWEIPLESGLVVVCAISDPGNLGTMVRMGEAAGVRGILLAKDSVDPFHPKSLRASMGSVFRLPVMTGADGVDAEKVLAADTTGLVQVVAAVAHGGIAPDSVDLTRPTHLLVGHETKGIPDELLKLASHRVTIPLARHVESLNVAMATAILLYEFMRQQAMREAKLLQPRTSQFDVRSSGG